MEGVLAVVFLLVQGHSSTRQPDWNVLGCFGPVLYYVCICEHVLSRILIEAHCICMWAASSYF